MIPQNKHWSIVCLVGDFISEFHAVIHSSPIEGYCWFIHKVENIGGLSKGRKHTRLSISQVLAHTKPIPQGTSY